MFLDTDQVRFRNLRYPVISEEQLVRLTWNKMLYVDYDWDVFSSSFNFGSWPTTFFCRIFFGRIWFFVESFLSKLFVEVVCRNFIGWNCLSYSMLYRKIPFIEKTRLLSFVLRWFILTCICFSTKIKIFVSFFPLKKLFYISFCFSQAFFSLIFLFCFAKYFWLFCDLCIPDTLK